jgi:hypothetical protein
VTENILQNQMHNNSELWLRLSSDDKLLQFASFLSHMRKDFRLGSIVGVYILLKNSNTEPEIIRVLADEIFGQL